MPVGFFESDDGRCPDSPLCVARDSMRKGVVGRAGAGFGGDDGAEDGTVAGFAKVSHRSVEVDDRVGVIGLMGRD